MQPTAPGDPQPAAPADLLALAVAWPDHRDKTPTNRAMRVWAVYSPEQKIRAAVGIAPLAACYEANGRKILPPLGVYLFEKMWNYPAMDAASPAPDPAAGPDIRSPVRGEQS